MLFISLFLANATFIRLRNYGLSTPGFKGIVSIGQLVSKCVLTLEKNFSKQPSTERVRVTYKTLPQSMKVKLDLKPSLF